MELKTKTIKLYGTTIDIKISSTNSEEILENCINLLYKYNLLFSANDKNSKLMEINDNSSIKAIKVDRELFELIEIGKYHSLPENSNLNISIGPLVKAWSIGFNNPTIPSDSEIKELLSITDPNKIILNKKNKTVFLKDRGMEIDLGSIAKGYISDKIMEYIKSQNVQCALINMGGNVLTYGFPSHNIDGNWRIGIQNPKLKRGNHVMLLAVNNMSIVTSGVYERKFEKNGKLYHHILDPITGYPTKTNIQSISILSKKSVDCEIWTTRLFGKSEEEILKEVSQQNHIEAVIIKENEDVLISKGIKKYIIF